jgi:hypothetical protein
MVISRSERAAALQLRLPGQEHNKMIGTYGSPIFFRLFLHQTSTTSDWSRQSSNARLEACPSFAISSGPGTYFVEVVSLSTTLVNTT